MAKAELIQAGKYGNGWSDRTLVHCIRAAYTFSEEEIVYAVRIQFTWTHLLAEKLQRAVAIARERYVEQKTNK